MTTLQNIKNIKKHYKYIFVITVIVCVASYYYFKYYKSYVETFQPESTYSMKDYYLERPPIGSTIVKHELSSGVLENELSITNNNKIKFGQKDSSGNMDTQFSLGVDNNHMRLHLKDDKNNINAFQVWGGACTAQGDCSKEGTNLHAFNDSPAYYIRSLTGKQLHHLDSVGNAHHTGDVRVGEMAKPKHLIDGKSGNQYTTGVINSKDVNVRGRIYFSQATHNEEIDPKKTGHSKIHDTDPYYIEKVNYGPNKNRLRITINGDSDKASYGWPNTGIKNAGEAIEIFSSPCDTKKGCSGEGQRIALLDGQGNLHLKGNVHTNNRWIGNM